MTTPSNYPVRLAPGDTVRVELPYSEVCLHMKIAGAVHDVELLRGGSGLGMAQVLDHDGRPYSFPITQGEAGIYMDRRGFYAYAAPAVPR
jgi:hypothetical protein